MVVIVESGDCLASPSLFTPVCAKEFDVPTILTYHACKELCAKNNPCDLAFVASVFVDLLVVGLALKNVKTANASAFVTWVIY